MTATQSNTQGVGAQAMHDKKALHAAIVSLDKVYTDIKGTAAEMKLKNKLDALMKDMQCELSGAIDLLDLRK